MLLLKTGSTGLAVNLCPFFFFRAMGANLRQIEKEEAKRKGGVKKVVRR